VRQEKLNPLPVNQPLTFVTFVNGRQGAVQLVWKNGRVRMANGRSQRVKLLKITSSGADGEPMVESEYAVAGQIFERWRQLEIEEEPVADAAAE
jgi:hypothetical protein